jgi:hypothetical protein
MNYLRVVALFGLLVGLSVAGPTVAQEEGADHAQPGHPDSDSSHHANADATVDPDKELTLHFIDIVKAYYGPLRRPCDVLESVRQKCQGKIRCSVRVEDSLCPGGLDTGTQLTTTLGVNYLCTSGGKTSYVKANNPFTLTISCASFNIAPKVRPDR